MDLMNKYKYISEINLNGSKIHVRIEFMFNEMDSSADLEFDTIDECDDYLSKNYENLKDKYIKEKFRQYQNKISNQRYEINNLLKRSK